jgi:hypothetical protein
VLDAPALASWSKAKHEDQQGGRDGDTCSVARMLAHAVARPGIN